MIITRAIGRVSRAAAIVAAAALVAGATVSPASAATFEDPTNEAKASRVQPDEAKPAARNRKYCVMSTVTTGTMLTRKTCKTREAWIKEDGWDPAGKK